MAESKRVKGAKLMLALGSPAVDFKCDITTWRVTNDEKSDDATTFCDPDARQYFLTFTAIQSTEMASLWSHIWEHANDENVPFTIAPHGNEVPTEDEPHFVGTLTIGPKPEIGFDAGRTNSGTFEVTWEIDDEPTLDRGAEEEGD